MLPGPKGGPIWRGNFRKLTAWTKTVAGLGFAGLHFHDLRHTHASLLLKAGVHPKVVSERLGHGSVSFTLDVYSHVMPGVQREAVGKLEMLLSGGGK